MSKRKKAEFKGASKKVRTRREPRAVKPAGDTGRGSWVSKLQKLARQARGLFKVLTGLAGDVNKFAAKLRPLVISIAALAILVNHFLSSNVAPQKVDSITTTNAQVQVVSTAAGGILHIGSHEEQDSKRIR